MSYGTLEAVINLVHYRKRAKVLDALQSGRAVDVGFEHKLYVCPVCETPTERFDYRVRCVDGTVLRPRLRCGRCRSDLVDAEEPIMKYRCPKCRNRTLSDAGPFLWD
jgi:uncharacterized CHY-type Zn-finger protein